MIRLCTKLFLSLAVKTLGMAVVKDDSFGFPSLLGRSQKLPLILISRPTVTFSSTNSPYLFRTLTEDERVLVMSRAEANGITRCSVSRRDRESDKSPSRVPLLRFIKRIYDRVYERTRYSSGTLLRCEGN